jgi:hypothetical protein
MYQIYGITAHHLFLLMEVLCIVVTEVSRAMVYTHYTVIRAKVIPQ